MTRGANWSVKHKAKTWAILFRIFSKIKKAELRIYFVYSHTLSHKIQMQTNVHRAWASCGSATWFARVSWSMLWLVTITIKSFQIFQMFTVLLVWQSRNFILNIYQLMTAKSEEWREWNYGDISVEPYTFIMHRCFQ